MRFALFYEIPVARPWGPDSEHLAYQNTLEQASPANSYGWDAFWTVEHHFLEEYSHCSNPEVLYGAIAARTERHAARLRRAPDAQAVQPSGPHGRVGRGARPASPTAASTSAPAARRPAPSSRASASTPAQTRGMWQEAIGHVVGCWTNDEYEFEGKHWSMPKRRVLPKPLQ